MAISTELGSGVEAVVEDLVRNGRYNSKSEVLREGVRLVQEREAKLAHLRRELDIGMADINARRTTDADTVIDRSEAKYLALSKSR